MHFHQRRSRFPCAFTTSSGFGSGASSSRITATTAPSFPSLILIQRPNRGSFATAAITARVFVTGAGPRFDCGWSERREGQMS